MEKLYISFAVAALLFVAGCAPVVTACPPLVAYTPEFNRRLADELEAMPAGTAVERAILDYATLRDQVKVCR